MPSLSWTPRPGSRLVPDPHGQRALAGPCPIRRNPAPIPDPTAGVPSLSWTHGQVDVLFLVPTA
ncbi:hypothetical protein SKAU_G00336090 [Synaphobranchus kaupii]|uniref:Uncharacterized protein n=1 Tax=Synaphobranchus kaupii TaxID=118154 RepID=A0A9Q1EM46_SYNKA|nr:hypothetical protein SKAU_G00336090 [Synaphobranchus kaupii]